MNEKVFVDTNILVYAHDRDAGKKHIKAQELIRSLWHSGNVAISTQVLQEFYLTLRRKMSNQITISQARGAVENYFAWEVVKNNCYSILKASEIEERYQLSFWDSLIIAAAADAGSAYIWTEDLNHGQLIEGMRIENPLK
ncbi:MAG: PIN domain-containing protein [Deltaproteobacteria bacterium]|nr:PIN domain-containing protein [Deltaproteobacteria bacterium]